MQSSTLHFRFVRNHRVPIAFLMSFFVFHSELLGTDASAPKILLQFIPKGKLRETNVRFRDQNHRPLLQDFDSSRESPSKPCKALSKRPFPSHKSLRNGHPAFPKHPPNRYLAACLFLHPSISERV